MPVYASRGLIAVYLSQALSAFADNALLIIAIALLKNANLSDQAPEIPHHYRFCSRIRHTHLEIETI